MTDMDKLAELRAVATELLKLPTSSDEMTVKAQTILSLLAVIDELKAKVAICEDRSK